MNVKLAAAALGKAVKKTEVSTEEAAKLIEGVQKAEEGKCARLMRQWIPDTVTDVDLDLINTDDWIYARERQVDKVPILAAQITKDGFLPGTSIILRRAGEGTLDPNLHGVLDGMHRTLAMKSLGKRTIPARFILPGCPPEDLKYLAVHINDSAHGTVSTKLGDHIVRFLDVRDTLREQMGIDIALLSGEVLNKAFGGGYGWASSASNCNKIKRCAQLPKDLIYKYLLKDVHDGTNRFGLKNFASSGLAQRYVKWKEKDPDAAYKVIDGILGQMAEPTSGRWGPSSVRKKLPFWKARMKKLAFLKLLDIDADERAEFEDGIVDGRYDLLCMDCFPIVFPPERTDVDEAVAHCQSAGHRPVQHTKSESDESDSSSEPSETEEEGRGKGKGKGGEGRKRKKESPKASSGEEATTTKAVPTKPADLTVVPYEIPAPRVIALPFGNVEFEDLLVDHINPAIAELSPGNRVVVISLGARFDNCRLFNRFSDAARIDPTRPVVVVSYAKDAAAVRGLSSKASTTVWTPLSRIHWYENSSTANVDVFSASFDNRTSYFLAFTTMIDSYNGKDPAMFLFSKNSAALHAPAPKVRKGLPLGTVSSACVTAIIARLTSLGDLVIDLTPMQSDAHTIVPLMGRHYLGFIDIVDSDTAGFLTALADQQPTVLDNAKWGSTMQSLLDDSTVRKLARSLGVTPTAGNTAEGRRGRTRTSGKKKSKESELSEAVIVDSDSETQVSKTETRKTETCKSRVQPGSIAESGGSDSEEDEGDDREGEEAGEDTIMGEAQVGDQLAAVLATAAMELESQGQQQHDPAASATAEILQQMAEGTRQSTDVEARASPDVDAGATGSVTASAGASEQGEVRVADPDKLFQRFKNGGINSDTRKQRQGNESEVQMNRRIVFAKAINELKPKKKHWHTMRLDDGFDPKVFEAVRRAMEAYPE